MKSELDDHTRLENQETNSQIDRILSLEDPFCEDRNDKGDEGTSGVSYDVFNQKGRLIEGSHEEIEGVEPTPNPDNDATGKE